MMKGTRSDLEREVPEGLRNSLGFLINKAARLLTEDVTEKLKPLGLSLYEYVVLRILEMGQADNQQTVGQRYGIDRTTMVEIVDRLESRELITRQKNPDDRRNYILNMTTKGRKTLARAKRIADKAQREFLQPLQEAEQEQLRSYLRRLITGDRQEENPY